MKIPNPAIVLLAVSGGASAFAIPRGVPQLGKILNDVTSQLTELDTATKDYKGDVQPLFNAADKVIASLTEGQEAVKGSNSIGLFEASQLLTPAQKLEKGATALLKDTKERVVDFGKNKHCHAISTKFNLISDGTHQLIEAVLAKVDNNIAQGLAKPFIANIKGLLSQANELFTGGSCVDAN